MPQPVGGQDRLVLCGIATSRRTILPTLRRPQRNGKYADGRVDAAARRDRGGRQDHQVVQVGGRDGCARRQPVRDRDRQGIDGGAIDHRRRAGRDPRAGRRGGPGRRGGCRHLRGWGDRRRIRPQPLPLRRVRRRRRHRLHCLPERSPARPRPRPIPRRLHRSSSTRSSRCAPPRATTVRRGFPAATG